MRRLRRPGLRAAAWVLAAALPTLTPAAQEAREDQGDTSLPSADDPRETVAPQDARATSTADADALRQQWDAERAELVAEQRRTEDELAAVRELNADLEDDRQIRWMLIGGGLVLIGLVLGVLIKSRPQRRDAWQ